MLHTSGGIQVFRAADRSLSTYQYKSFKKIIKWNLGKSENFFHEKTSFRPLPEPLSHFQKKRCSLVVFFLGWTYCSLAANKKASLGDWLGWSVFFNSLSIDDSAIKISFVYLGTAGRV